MLRLTPRRRGRGDRGASAVEFAIVVPVFLLILIGILEFSFVMRDYLSVSSSVRTGTRTAATGANAGPCDTLTCGTGVPTGVPKLAQAAADAIQRAGTAMPQDSIDYIWIYRANASGYPGSATTAQAALAAGCTTDCVSYRWIDAQDRFRYQSGTWQSSTINACINDAQAQSVGILMSATHPFITKFIRSSLTMSDRSVAKFEPLENATCNGLGLGSGGHA